MVAALAGALLAAALVGIAPASPAEAAFPGTNGRLAYVDGNGDIATVAPDGSSVETLTSGGNSDHPRWSPDGERIVFASTRNGASDIYVMDAGGGNRTRLTNSAADDVEPAWAPDGSRIVFASDRVGGGRHALYVMDADGSDVRRLTTEDDTSARNPAWSPQGDRIAFERHVDFDDSPTQGTMAIFTVAPDGSALTRVTSGETASRDDAHPDWSPDGTRITFTTGPYRWNACTPAVATIGADGTGEQTLDKVGCWNYEPVWSPDGTKIAYTIEPWFDYEHGGIHVADTDGRNRQLLVAGFNPDWQAIEPELSAACPAAQVPEHPFSDLAGNHHAPAIGCLVWWDVVSGYPDGTYRPAEVVNRAQMAGFIARSLRASGIELPPPDTPFFTDLGNNVHAPDIEALREVGIIGGVGGTRYSPRDPVTRGQMTRFLVGAYEHASGEELGLAPADRFTDVPGTTHETTIRKSAAAGFAHGYPDDTYRPGNPVRRDHMGAFIARMLNRLVDRGHAPPRD